MAVLSRPVAAVELGTIRKRCEIFCRRRMDRTYLLC